MPRTKAELETPKCPICGQEMFIEYDCNFEMMIKRAGWYLDFDPRTKMCKKCSDELVENVNKWFAKREKISGKKSESRKDWSKSEFDEK